MSETLVLIIIILLVLFFVLLWIFWPKRKIKEEYSMIGSFGTDLKEGTSQPSFKSSTQYFTSNPLSTDPYSKYSTKTQESDFDDEVVYTDIPSLDPLWLH